MQSRLRRASLLTVAVIAVVGAGCKDGVTTPTNLAHFAGTPITIRPSAVTLLVDEQELLVGEGPGMSSGTGVPSWISADPSIARLQPNGGQALVTCVSAGSTTVRLTGPTVSSPIGPIGPEAQGVVTCLPRSAQTTTPPPATPPPTAPPPTPGPTTVDQLVGTYTKRGVRSETSNCNPPVFGSSFDSTLTIERNTEGNLGIRFIETHSDNISLFYSQFDQERVEGGLKLISGSPTRSIGGVSHVTQITITVTATGISGTETFRRVSPPCTDTYILSGARR